jgi:rare lipoprotein A
MRHVSALACAVLLLSAATAAHAEDAPAAPAVAVPGHKPPVPLQAAHRSQKRRTAREHAARHHAAAAVQAAGGPREIGEASWYGTRQTIGHRTASGERFDPTRLTAAHPSLPMNTEVRVENLANGRSVTVRINDRGPDTKDRIIDLSPRAAELLGMKRRGVARVAVVPLAPVPAAGP